MAKDISLYLPTPLHFSCLLVLPQETEQSMKRGLVIHLKLSAPEHTGDSLNQCLLKEAID